MTVEAGRDTSRVTAQRDSRRRRTSDRGATLVEFALVLPVLTLFLFGIVQFGIAYDKQQSINAAAREGARIASLSTTSLDELSGRAVAAADMSAMGNDPKIVVSVTGGAVAGVRCPGGTFSATDDCGSAVTIDEADPALMPCGTSPGADYVTVQVSTPYELPFPFFDFGSVSIEAEAQFRCE